MLHCVLCDTNVEETLEHFFSPLPFTVMLARDLDIEWSINSHRESSREDYSTICQSNFHYMWREKKKTNPNMHNVKNVVF